MELYYTREHEWLRVEGNEGVAGITRYAVDQLGDITYVQLPETGKKFKQEDVLCEIESVKAASEVFAPVSGDIIEVNEKLQDSPETINASPEDEGWIAKIRIEDPSETDSLMKEEEYKKYSAEVE